MMYLCFLSVLFFFPWGLMSLDLWVCRFFVKFGNFSAVISYSISCAYPCVLPHALSVTHMSGCLVLSHCRLMFRVYHFGWFLLLCFQVCYFFFCSVWSVSPIAHIFSFYNRYLYLSLSKVSLGLHVFRFFPHRVLSSSFLSTCRIFIIEILTSLFTNSIICAIFRSVSIV